MLSICKPVIRNCMQGLMIGAGISRYKGKFHQVRKSRADFFGKLGIVV